MVIEGDFTQAEVLEDAGVADCGAFISASRDDEDNILSCVLAKKLGAGKVINVSNKGEYMDIVPSMSAIDCGFSPRVGAVTAVLSLLGSDAVRVHAILHRAHAYVYGFEVQKNARVCNRRIADCGLSATVIFSLVFRGGATLPATGDVVLRENDVVSVLTVPQDVPRLERYFCQRGVFGL
jgi:trk system potassium uptake protein TrkA